MMRKLVTMRSSSTVCDLAHGQAEAIAQRAEIALNHIGIHVDRLVVFTQQQAEELVHALDPRAAFERKLVDEFLKLGGHDSPDSLKILGLVQRRIEGGETGQQRQYLVERALRPRVNARLCPGQRAHVGLDGVAALLP